MFIKNIFFTLIIIIVQFVPLNSYSVEPNEILQNKKQELKARIISKNIRCMICQNQSIDESEAELAKDLRVLIRNKIKEGLFFCSNAIFEATTASLASAGRITNKLGIILQAIICSIG